MPVLDPRNAAVFGISPRMAEAVTDPLRVRILAEISRRPLSPSEFVQTVGGEVSSVGRSFRQLQDWGYLEVLEERAGKRRGASVQHVYGRAVQTPSQAAIRGKVTEENGFPPSLNQFFHQVSDAIACGTFDQDLDRHLSHDEILLDEVGWGQLRDRQRELLGWLPELEEEAAERVGSEGCASIPATVGFALTPAARPAAQILRTSLEEYPPAPERGNRFEVSPKMAKALANPWRSRILTEMSSRPMSPSQFVEEVGGEPSYVARCFRELAEWGLLELVEERRGGRRGGGVERIYRGLHRMYFDSETWVKLPSFFRNEVSTEVLRDYLRRIDEAVRAGALRAEQGWEFGSTTVNLDRKGWRALAERLDSTLFWAPEVGRESIARTTGNVDELVPTIVGMAAFRSASSTTG